MMLSLLHNAVANAADNVQTQESFDYQLFCQGCHGPTGIGGRGVPKIHNTIGTFLGSQDGREYLVRVPGAANAPLNDDRLAKLMNWTISRFAEASEPDSWTKYTEKEVADYRSKPLLEVEQYRERLLSTLSKQ